MLLAAGSWNPIEVGQLGATSIVCLLLLIMMTKVIPRMTRDTHRATESYIKSTEKLQDSFLKALADDRESHQEERQLDRKAHAVDIRLLRRELKHVCRNGKDKPHNQSAPKE